MIACARLVVPVLCVLKATEPGAVSFFAAACPDPVSKTVWFPALLAMLKVAVLVPAALGVYVISRVQEDP